jgi:hypothetical protein
LVEVMVREWPDARLALVLHGILPGDPFSRDARRDLRDVGIPTPLNIDGKAVVGIGYMALGGRSAQIRQIVGRLQCCLRKFLHQVAANPNHVADILRERGDPVPAQFDLHFEFFETGGFGITDTQARRIVRLG